MNGILPADPIVPFAPQMAETPQPARWHGEGDVLTHTRMVVRALDDVPGFSELPERQREILRAAAWLHDIGKIRQTRLVAGEWEAPSHSSVGSRMAREHLWRGHGLCGSPGLMQAREAVCLLVRHHSLPPHAIDSPDGALRLHRIAAAGQLVPDFTVRLLCMLSRADMMGRECDDREEMLCQIALCEELAKEEGCYDGPYPFPTAQTRHAFLAGRDVWKDQKIHDDTWGEVILMSGLPGTGKDTWISHNCPELPVVSLDDIRRARRIPPTAPQGLVANIAKEQAREHLRRHEPFVWNATNLTESTRRQLIALMESYRARVHVVYLETDWQTQHERNASRPAPAVVPPPVIASMLAKLAPPLPAEARTVIWHTV